MPALPKPPTRGLENRPAPPYLIRPMADKTAIVTGAGSGVGRVVVLRLAGDGWSVAVVGRRAEQLEQTRSLAGANAQRVFALPCDIADPAAVDRMVAAAVERLGGVQ